MGKILHSCDPNMYCIMENFTFIAKKNIKAGDILYMDYEQTVKKSLDKSRLFT